MTAYNFSTSSEVVPEDMAQKSKEKRQTQIKGVRRRRALAMKEHAQRLKWWKNSAKTRDVVHASGLSEVD